MPSDAPAGGWRRWLRLFGRESGPGEGDPAADAQQVYARDVLDVLAQCEGWHQGWLEQLEEERRNERLANAAAVYHWRLKQALEQIVGLQAPPALQRWHTTLVAAVDAAQRATRLLSNGYRFYDVRRICDGGLLLEEARAEGQAVREALLTRGVPPARGSPAEGIS